MSSELIHCLVYRYYRIRERICAVKIKDSQYVTLEETEYKSDQEFFLNSVFSDFLESKENSFDLCIIIQDEDKGKEFLDMFQTHYNLTDFPTVWTEEKIQEAMQCLNLKKSLRIGNIVINGKDSRFDYASVYSESEQKKQDMRSELQDDNSDSIDDYSDEKACSSESVDVEEKSYSDEVETSKNKSSLFLAMEQIILEDYKDK